MKILISDTVDPNFTTPNHPVLVRDACKRGNPNLQDSDFLFYKEGNLSQNSFDYASANNCDIIIRSTTEAQNEFTTAENNPSIMLFMPHSNYSGSVPKQIVLTGKLPTTYSIEFGDDTEASDSESNGYIAGQITYIAQQRNCSVQEARICANATKDSNSKIDVTSAVNYSGTVELTVGELTAERTTGFSVTLTLDYIIDAFQYEIYRNGTLIATVTDLTYNDTLLDYGTYEYKYRGVGNINSSYSDETEVNYQIIDFFLVMEEDMSFGFQVNTYQKAAEGDYGYTIKLDIVDYRATEIEFVQAKNQPLGIEDPVTSESTMAQLMSYLNDSDCPDLAYNFDGEQLTVFFSSSKFPYSDDDVRFAFGGKRNPQPVVETTDEIDCDESKLELLKLYILEGLYNDKGQLVPQGIRKKIAELEDEVKNNAT